MTNQEAFDTIVAHLRQQNDRAVLILDGAEQGSSCMYRTAAGLKCAVGCLIPDDQYHADFDDEEQMQERTGDENVGTGVCIVAPFIPALEGLNLDFLEDMQSVHDNSGVDLWEESWKTIADQYGLTYTKP